MERRAIVVVPSLPAEPIASLRGRFDPLADHVPPHLTLVFPFESELGAADLRAHVEHAVRDVAPFALRLAGIVGSEGEYLFLTVKRGNDALVALHDRLYEGPLRPYLSREQPFLPHLTLGRLPDAAAFRAALAEAASLNVDVETEARSVTIYRIATSGERAIESEIPLVSMPSGDDMAVGPGPIAVPTLGTARLLLRPFVPEDAPAVAALASAPEIAATTLNLPHPYTLPDAERWIARQAAGAARGDSMDWALVRREDDALLGALNLGIVARHRRGSLGYWLGTPFWNQGYMTEAVRAVVAYAFGPLGLHRVEAGCFPRNRASARVMEKAGLCYEGRQRAVARKDDVFEDVDRYARLRTDTAG